MSKGMIIFKIFTLQKTCVLLFICPDLWGPNLGSGRGTHVWNGVGKVFLEEGFLGPILKVLTVN